MKRILLLLCAALCSLHSFSQKNLTLLSTLTVAATRTAQVTYAGVWHYNDNSGNEYALLCSNQGLSIIKITDPFHPQDVFDVPDSISEWHEVKVWSHYAYVSTDATRGGGVMVINLANLPSGTPVYKKYTGDGIISNALSTAHTIEVANGYLYINGSNLFNRGTLICSLADPWNPSYVGKYDGSYVHDCFVRGDTLITSEIYNLSPNPNVSILNIADKTNPVIMGSTNSPRQFNHNSWMSDDNHYLFTTDERANAPLGAFDISDLNNIQLVDLYWPNKNPVGEVHNVRVLNNFLVNACYGDASHTGSQVTLVDATKPDNLIEVGDFPLSNANTSFNISWDVDPYLPSGNVIATQGLNGLFIFKPAYVHACYLEGTVTDSITNAPLNDVKVELIGASILDSTIYTGAYKTGLADAGVFNVRFSLNGYITRTISSVVLNNGVLTTLNVKLLNNALGINNYASSPLLFNAYPNPASLDFHISIDPALITESYPLHIYILDMMGRTVKEVQHVHDPVTTISRNGIASGIYTIELMDDSKRLAEAAIFLQ